MFGLDFLFASALWALPLAGLPVVLHLLFRKKSPIVPFSTVRFVRASVQRTAARRRVQRWLLLGVRALLIALLVWAVAQPARRLAASWAGGAAAPVAAVVVDTSYSMLLADRELPLIERADAVVQSLLREQLRDARVALFTSRPADQPEIFRPAATVLAEWAPLAAQPAEQLLIDRVTAAVAVLRRQDGDPKWLFVVSDLQAKEFPRPIANVAGLRVVLLDLHPDAARSAGVTRVQIRPERPIPGVGSEAVVSLAGRPGESRAVTVRVAAPDGQSFGETPAVAALDGGGRATVRVPLRLPAERWLTLSATVGGGDAMAWDDARTAVVEVPPRRIVAVVDDAATPSPAARFVRLALDPSEGTQPSWPLAVTRAAPGAVPADARVVVRTLTKWPAAAEAARLRDLARGGGTVVLLLQPGLEQTWAVVPDDAKRPLTELLPSAPVATSPPPGATYRAAAATVNYPLLDGLTDESAQLGAITVSRYVPFDPADRAVERVLTLTRDGAGGPAAGLVFRRPVGAGAVVTFATLPDPRLTNLATHPAFLPLLVRAAMARPASVAAAVNVELGQPVTLRDPAVTSAGSLEVQTPGGGRFAVPVATDADGLVASFAGTSEVGLYTFRAAGGGGGDVLAVASVQPPADESALAYRTPADVAAGENVVVARSPEELAARFATLAEPEPRWSGPIALVLLLLCAEAVMGSATKPWQWRGAATAAPA